MRALQRTSWGGRPDHCSDIGKGPLYRESAPGIPRRPNRPRVCCARGGANAGIDGDRRLASPAGCSAGVVVRGRGFASSRTTKTEENRQDQRTSEPRKPTLPLFDSPADQGAWVDALLSSEVFAEQMETFAGRLRKDHVEEYLRVLVDRKLVLLKTAFAQKLGISALRVDGLIASLQRILNVEGYAVLSVDSSQTIRLNLQLLREQFELGDTDGR